MALTIRELYIAAHRWVDPAAEYTASTKLLNSKLFLGVELELEGCKYTLLEQPMDTVGDIALPDGLHAHKDGSLRNGGIELVTPPVRGERLVKLVDYICSLADKKGWVPSNRAGLHVHVDVQSLTTAQVVNLIKLYTLTEPVFFNLAGHERKGSIYCKPWFQSAAFTDQMRNTLKNMSNGAWDDIPSRYLGLNINSIIKHGTIEFRHKHSTTDAQEILDWINIISRWYDFGMSVDLTPDVVSSFTPDSLVQQVFGDKSVADVEFPSYFYHGCIPTWYDLFGPEIKDELKWARGIKAEGHRGFKNFMASHKLVPQVMPPAPAGLTLPVGTAYMTMDDFNAQPLPVPPIEPEDGDVVSIWDSQLRTTIYFDRPPLKPNRSVGNTHNTRFGRIWEPVWGRSDLWYSHSTPHEQARGAGQFVYRYGPRID